MDRLVRIIAALVVLGGVLSACATLEGALPPPGDAPDTGDPEPTDPDPTDPAPGDPTDPPVPVGTQRVAVHSDGTLANGDSSSPVISHGGRYVAFASAASNLVDGDGNGVADIFIHDRVEQTTTRVSVSGSGNEASGASGFPSISADGRFIAFTSSAANLVDGDTNGVSDVFVHDRMAGTTERASVGSDGAQLGDGSSRALISGDGRFVYFTSGATAFVHDREAATTQALPAPSIFAVSADGRFGVHTRQTQVELVERTTGATELISVTSEGAPGASDSVAGALSADGRYVVFHSLANDLVDDFEGDWREGWQVMLRDRDAATNELISLDVTGGTAGNFSLFPDVSADGRFVAFMSVATDLMEHQTHLGWSVFVRDRLLAATERVPVSSGEAGGPPFEAAISGDGRHVAFTSVATFMNDGYEAGVEGIDAHPDGVIEVFVHGFPD